MRHNSSILILLFLLSLPLVAFSQMRSENDIKKICKKGIKNERRVLVASSDESFNALCKGDEISIRKSLEKITTTELEDTLLNLFDDVIVHSKFPKCYFIIKNNDIGICKLDGTIIVPPFPGHLRMPTGTLANCLIVGDIAPWKEYEDFFESWVKEKKTICFGQMACVLNKKDLSPIVPFGQYDYIGVGGVDYFLYFFVGKKNGDDYTWGVINKKGEITVPCEYSYIRPIKKGLLYKYEGTNDKKNLLSDITAVKEKIKAWDGCINPNFWGNVGEWFGALGDGIIKLDDNLNKIGFYNFVEQYSSAKQMQNSTSSEYNVNTNTHQPSSNNTSGMSLSDAQNYQSLRNTYNKWKDDLYQMKNANGKYQNGYTISDKKHAQSQMKQIRQMASSKWGKEIPKDSIEDW